MKRALLAMLLVSCAGPQKPAPVQKSKDVEANERVRAALAKLPACGPARETRRLEFDGQCTLKSCPGVVSDGVVSPAPACCNGCGWTASLINAAGEKTPVDSARVRDALDLGESSFDCELKVWREVTFGLEFSFDGEACVARQPDVVATLTVAAALSKLPKCQPGADVGRLVIESTTCTRMFCSRACCNQCGWDARFEGMSGDAQPVDSAVVKKLLELGESSLDCEVKAWNAALKNESLSLDEKCVVR